MYEIANRHKHEFANANTNENSDTYAPKKQIIFTYEYKLLKLVYYFNYLFGFNALSILATKSAM